MEMIRMTVFSDGPGGGNPAPVFFHADGMTDGEMQAAAAKLGEECVFVLKPDRPDCGVRLRYFVPDHELTLCAHDTIGAVTVLAGEGMLSGDSVMISTGAGAVKAQWQKDEKGLLVMLEQFLPEFRAPGLAPEELAGALRIGAEELAVSAGMPAECASTSRFKLMVPVKDRAVLDSLRPDLERLWEECDACGCSGFYVFARDPERPDACYARQFPLRSGYDEDAATGIAAAALGAYWVKYKLAEVREGWNRLHVYQGHAMGRPSYLAADIRVTEKTITGVRVCGYAEKE